MVLVKLLFKRICYAPMALGLGLGVSHIAGIGRRVTFFEEGDIELLENGDAELLEDGTSFHLLEPVGA